MKNLQPDLFTKPFSHIYIEETILKHPRVQTILKHFPDARQILIRHYKDVFCRPKQNLPMQKSTPMLILARKEQNLIYEGAPVCQNFGYKNFYYTSCIMNCIYCCDYCYLQGMYPSGNLVIFINLEDIFQAIEEKLKHSDIYLCISYDTDLLALEGLTGYVKEWIAFAGKHPGLTIEIRTKSASFSTIELLKPIDNVTLAWTLSPQVIVEKYEHHTLSFSSRLSAAKSALKKGWPVRLCFDPMIYTSDWKYVYQDMVTQVFKEIDGRKIQDASVGIFRVSKAYLKKMRKQNPDSSVLFYPYCVHNGVYEYEEVLAKQMVTFLIQELSKYIPSENIFSWEAQNPKED